MAVDMSNVKQIMHNNKEVIKIEDSLGHIIWQKESEPQWHTVWEGSVYCAAYANYYTSPPTVATQGNGTVLYTVNTTTLPNPENIQCRVTFTGMDAWLGMACIPSNRTSPYTITGIDTAKTIIQAVGSASTSPYKAYAELRITRSGNTSSFKIYCQVKSTHGGKNYGAQFTVKKLELYY